jgi:hypothetical protein
MVAMIAKSAQWRTATDRRAAIFDHPGDRSPEVGQELAKGTDLLLGKRVQTVLLEPPPRLVGRQTARGIGAQPDERLLRGQRAKTLLDLRRRSGGGVAIVPHAAIPVRRPIGSTANARASHYGPRSL